MSASLSSGRKNGLRLAALTVTAGLATSGCSVRDAYENTFAFGFPDPITDQAKVIYDLWLGSVAAAMVVGLFVWGLIFWAVVRYRKNSDDLPRQIRYNLPVEVLYTVVPFVIIGVLFYYTVVAQNNINKLTDNPDVTIGVVGFKWNWQFQHENAGVQVTGKPGEPAQLVLPTDRTIRFVETSPDVIHSFWVPEFLFKRDVIPGRFNTFEVTIREQGVFTGRCAELCGEKHSKMNFNVKVVSGAEYDAYIRGLQSQPDAAITTTSVAKLAAQNGAVK